MKRAYCKECYKELHQMSIYTGFCINCAEKKKKAIKKMLIICTIVGSALAFLLYWIIYFMQFKSDGTFYGTEVGFRVYLFFITMRFDTYCRIGIVLLCLPFGLVVDASYLPYMNTEYYEGNAFITLLKWTLCTIAAPIIVIYLLFYIHRLGKYVALGKEKY